MKSIIKSFLKKLINFTIVLFSKTSLGRYLFAQIVVNAMNRTKRVNHLGLELLFSTPNALNQYRADTFSTKEPETLEWIEAIPKKSVVWDIGANVGLYSCYAAKQRNCRVFSFEPSVFNLELLARNIFINELTENITIVPLPLSDKLAFNMLNMTSTEWGGALSSFGQSYGYDGQPMRKIFEIPTIGISMIDAVNFLNIPQPDFIKMDVDGIEHLILKGGIPVMDGVKGILIEINDSFSVQANNASKYLRQAGFILTEKRHAEIYDTGVAEHVYNQIWVK